MLMLQRSFDFKTDNDQRVHQELTAYLADREVVQRTSVDGEHETWTVDDFNRVTLLSTVVERLIQFERLQD